MLSRICNRKESLSCSFLLTSRAQIQVFVNGIFELNQDINKFKMNVRDFLIQLKEFSGDNTELYLDEKEDEAAQREKAERERALNVPGMVKPADLPATMDEEL